MIEYTEPDDPWKAFREERQQGIGSTDSAVVLGLAGSRFRLWQEKVGQSEPKVQTLPMWLGLKMQATVGELYHHATGRRIRADNRLHRHPDHDWLFTHLDYRTIGTDRRLVECKTSSQWNLWGPDGSDDIPPKYWVQCQHEMAVLNYGVCDLAVLLGNREFRNYPIERDDAFIAQMVAADDEFWTQHVLAGIPPIDGSEEAERYLRQRYPDPTEDLRPATPEETLIAERYRLGTEQVKEGKAIKALAQQELEDRIGLGEGIYGPGFRITWKRNADSTEVAWESMATSYRAAAIELLDLLDKIDDLPIAMQMDIARVDGQLPLIESVNTSTKPGPRVFRATWTRKD